MSDSEESVEAAHFVESFEAPQLSPEGICTWDLIPDDLQTQLFSFLSPLDCEKLSYVSKKFLTLSRNSLSWLRSFTKRYPDIDTRARQLTIPQLRKACLRSLGVRFDGVYVNKCVHVRVVGEGQSVSDKRTYISIVYYRLLRFHPNGKAIMATHPADNASGKVPKEILKRLSKFNLETATLRDYTQSSSSSSPTSKVVSASSWEVCEWSQDKHQVKFGYVDSKGSKWRGEMTLTHAEKKIPFLNWDKYHYWDERDVLRALNERLNQLRNRANNLLQGLLRVDEQVLNDIMVNVNKTESLIDEIQSSRNFLHLNIPDDLLNPLTIDEEHFPVMNFKLLKSLSYLF